MTGRLRKLLELLAPPLMLFLLIVLLWDRVVVWAGIPRYLMPRPGQVLTAAREHRGELFAATCLTAEAAVAGFALSLTLGTLTAMLLSQSRLATRGIYPYAIFLQTVPIVAIAPLIIAWFGNGMQSVVIVAFIISLFPIIAGATSGMTLVDSNLLELFSLHNASRGQTLVKLRLPHAAPYLVTAAKTSCGLAVIGAIVGEFYAGYGTSADGTNSHALGYLITLTAEQPRTDLLFATIGCSTLLGVGLFACVSAAGALVLRRWHGGGGRRTMRTWSG